MSPKPGRLGLATLVLALLALPTSVRASELTEARTALDAKTAKALEELAGWCTKKKIFGKRDEAYAALLEFDSEHEEAREKLRYAKGEDGAWVQDPKFKRGTNWKRGALPEYEQRFAAVLDGHRAEQLGLYERAVTIPDLLWARRELTAYARRFPGDARAVPLLKTVSLGYYRAAHERGLVQELAETAALLRSLYPEDIEVRTTLGETKHEDRWMLLESARFLRGAAGLDELIERTLRRMGPPTIAEPREAEAKIELPWKPGALAVDVRVMGTAEEKHLRDIAVRCRVTGPLFEAALRTEPVFRDGFTFYVFAEKGEFETFLDAYPVVDNPSLRRRDKMDIVNVDAYGMALRANPPVAQVDGCVYQLLKVMFSDTFLDSGDCRGWHAEGLVRYLAYKILGTRYSVVLTGRYGGQDVAAGTPQSEADWLARAHGLLARKAQVGLQLMLGKGMDAIDGRDATLSYAFAVYLIEGHEGLIAPFVRAVEKDADVRKACREILGAPLPVVEHRFRTWLDQVTKLKKEQAKKEQAEEPKK